MHCSNHLLFATILAVLAIAALATPWDAANDPSLFSSSYVYGLNRLATHANLTKMPWSDTYWPSFQSGIAHRWQAAKPHDFEYQRYTLQQLKTLSQQQIAQLSPAEKYDIFNSRYDYPTVQAEWPRTAPTDAQWEGLCHGWAPAAQFYNQPDAVTMKNKDGISIPFGSSDVKALLTYFVAMYDEGEAETLYIGQRCKYDLDSNPQYENKSECADMNAGAFHVVLANQLSSVNQGFIVDRDRSYAVWNQPVYAFNTTVLGTSSTPRPGAAHTATGSAHMLTVMAYGKETVPAWRAHPTYTIAEQYEYYLDLDAAGNVVGGTHVTWDRVDFAWNVGIADFFGYFANVKQIYNAATMGAHEAANKSPLSERVDRALDNRTTHTVLHDASGELAAGPYTGATRVSWSIAPYHATTTVTAAAADNSDDGSSTQIELVFRRVDTDPHRDTVRVYEGAHGEGALLAVLHGSRSDVRVVVRASAAYVVMTARADTAGGAGFEASYRVLGGDAIL